MFLPVCLDCLHPGGCLNNFSSFRLCQTWIFWPHNLSKVAVSDKPKLQIWNDIDVVVFMCAHDQLLRPKKASLDFKSEQNNLL